MEISQSEKKSEQLSMFAVILMIFTSVYGFNNGPRAFYKMGYGSIIWYILGALAFFIPYAFMMTELGAAFRKEKGGIYTWMAKSVNARFAFMGLIMWYASYVVWMMNVSMGLLVPLSNLFLGSDQTSYLHLGFLNYGQILGLFAVAWVCFVTFFSSRGIKSITKFTSLGGLAVMALNFILIIGGLIAWGLNGFEIQYGFSGNWLIESPNPASLTNHGVYIASFLVFAIFAYGGLEVIASLVDKIKDPVKNLPKAITISALVVSIGYALMIFIIGLFSNWEKVLGAEHMNLANVTYAIMHELGWQLAQGIGLSEQASAGFGSFLSRFAAGGIFLTLSGAFFTLSYSPLKTLIEGTPQEIWPAALRKEKNGLPVNAMWLQALLVIIFILISSLGGNTAKFFFDYIITPMTNVAMTIPYLFIIYAFYQFKKNKEIEKPIEIFKTQKSALVSSIIVSIMILYANLTSISEQLLTNGPTRDAVLSTVFQIIGPILFAALGLILARRAKI
jgi:amino acid transporter